MRKVFKWFCRIALVLIAALILAVLLNRPSLKVVAQWQQPKDIIYHSFDPYYLSVVEDNLDWSHVPFVLPRNYFIYVGTDSGKPIHGHVIKYSFHPSMDDLYDEPAHIKKSTVDWSADGVTFNEASGHKLFIPKQMFIGGR